MIGATPTHDTFMNPYQPEWQILCARRHNVLLEGPAAATDAVLSLMQSQFREPIRWRKTHEAVTLPDGETGALILRNITALSADDQSRLLEWMGHCGSQTQVVSTSVRPVFAQVTRGLFDEALYYRLNLMLLRIGTGNPSESQNDDDQAIAVE